MSPSDRPLPLLALLFAACATPPAAPAPAAAARQDPPAAGIVVAPALAAPQPPAGMRLPATVKPLLQRVELTITPASDRFQGTTELDVELTAASDTLWLNARDLTVTQGSVRMGDAELRGQISLSPERVALRLPRAVGPGPVTLRFAFNGVVSNTEDAGIFHQKEGGDWYVMSQFEETDARRAFPCFDEPSAKIPWELTLVVPKDVIAVSNTSITSEAPATDGMKRVRFGRTRPLPSYLVAFGVGPYDVVEARPAGANKIPMRVFTPRGRKAEAAYAAKSSPEILESLEAYFGMPFPYEKLDLLTIPLTVHFGAMENAGLVTVASFRLLAKPENDTVRFQRTWAEYAAHEFAHQWFGDYVTLAWWNDIWLNESFASWMEARALEPWQPTWGEKVGEVQDRSRAATSDTLVSARSIRQPIESYDDITNAFDNITYAKGASVLRMFESYLGPEAFRKGVQLYLRRHAYGTATASDFLQAISEATGRDVAPAFGSFLDQPGVPLVTASLSCAKGKPATLSLAQQRLLPVGTTGSTDSRWQVPVCARWSTAGKEHQACTLITGPTATLPLDGPGCPDWVLPNARYAGYYRLKLEGTLLHDLVTRGAKSLTTAETVGLLGDVGALVAAGRLPQAAAMELAARYAGASEREVVITAIDLARVRADFLEGGAAKAYPAWVRRHFGNRARVLGMTAHAGDDEETRLLRPPLVGFVALRGQDPQLIAEARTMTEQWLKDPASTDPDTTDTALTIAGWYADAPLHAKLVERLKASPDRVIRGKLLTALSAVQDPALVQSNMAVVLAKPIDLRELTRLFELGRSRETATVKAIPVSTREIVFRTVNENYDRLTAALPERSAAGLFFAGIYFCDPSHRQQVATAFGPRAEKALGGKRDLAQVLEAVDLCIADRAVQVPSISAYLAGKPAPASSRSR
jgi:alanyl aminopeptidase